MACSKYTRLGAIVGGSRYLMGANEKPDRKVHLDHESEALVDLQTILISEIAEFLDVKDVEKDLTTLQRRVDNEGISFVTKTLPAFGKNVLFSLKTGTFRRSESFSHGHGALPKFLSGFTSRLFDTKTGRILPEPCYVAAWAIHQITSFLYKYEFPYSKRAEVKMKRKMIETNKELPNITLELPQNHKLAAIINQANLLITEVLQDCDLENIVPRHGPGSTNEGGLEQYEKYRFRRFDELLDRSYPQGTYTSPCARDVAESDGWGLIPWSPPPLAVPSPARGLHMQRELRTSTVHAVNKDSRGPRIISAEAKELMWLQQGQNAAIVSATKRSTLTRGHVNFDDQSVNRRLALEGSREGQWATIDMCEASDRVSISLVGELFPSEVFAKLWATRSFYSRVPFPDGHEEIIFLRKFAPMGSAVCFPVESLCFWALTVATMIVVKKLPKREGCRNVFVYGDDIIIPNESYGDVVAVLELCGLVVNNDKSYNSGPFRESCGMDAFLGVDITPVRLKKRMPVGKSDAGRVAGWIKVANNLVAHGLPKTAESIFQRCEKILGPLPIVPRDCEVLGREREFESCDLKRCKPRPAKIRRIAGKGFTMTYGIDHRTFNRPDYQGYFVDGWALRSQAYHPNEDEFPETDAYMHFVSLKLSTGCAPEDARAFTSRRIVRLRKVRTVIS